MITNDARRTDQEWINLIQECRTSGLGDKDWCEQHGIPISTFYTKITRLLRKVCETPAAKHRIVWESQEVVPIPIIDEVPQPSRFEWHSLHCIPMEYWPREGQAVLPVDFVPLPEL